MRDLSRYPITLDEMIAAVERANIDYAHHLSALPLDKVPIGDTHGIALKAAAARLKRLQFAAQEEKDDG